MKAAVCVGFYNSSPAFAAKKSHSLSQFRDVSRRSARFLLHRSNRAPRLPLCYNILKAQSQASRKGCPMKATPGADKRNPIEDITAGNLPSKQAE